MRRFAATLVFPLAILLLATACSGAAPALPTATPNPQHTAAAQTIVALMTEVALPDTPTPAPGTAPGTAPAQPLPGQATSGEASGPAHSPTASGPTSTPEPTGTPTVSPTPTQTPPPTPTFAPGDPRTGLGDPTWQDSFADGSNWFMFEDDHVSMEVSGGKLGMVSLQTGNWDSWMLAYPILENFYLEGVFRPGKCQGNDRYGMLVRAPDPNQAYLFGVTCDGQYSFRRWDGTRNHWLVDWTGDEAIVDGANKTNRLGIRAEGRAFTLFANGKELASISDGNYREGGIGLFVGAGETPKFEVGIEEVTYWQLP